MEVLAVHMKWVSSLITPYTYGDAHELLSSGHSACVSGLMEHEAEIWSESFSVRAFRVQRRNI